jgi:acetyl/propionyl-CoA carboxylase alpha subunit
VKLTVVRTPRGVWVGWPGGARFFAPERAASAAEAAGGAEVRAPMTGRVIDLLVAPGSEVRKDDLLLILQAMKMEYRLTAPSAGTVASVHCAKGEMVDLGATLVTLREPAPAAGTPKGNDALKAKGKAPKTANPKPAKRKR